MNNPDIQLNIRHIRAGNPSPFTGTGTNTYLVGRGNVAVIDPGPALPDHRDAIIRALDDGEKITHIFVTHSHLDHSELAPELSAMTDAPILAYGDSAAGRSDHMSAFGDLGGGEGVHADFKPDILIKDDETVAGADWELSAHWTPGHFGNHLCFSYEDILFSGDLVMGWSTSLVSPPDGDLTAFMNSLDKLRARPHRRYLPGHGEAVDAPADRVDELLYHRRMRETQILEQLETAAADAAQLTKLIYTEVPAHLHPAAERNVLAHLIDLVQKNRVIPDGTLNTSATFRLK